MYSVSPKGVLLMTNFNFDLFKVSKSIHREWLILPVH